MGIGTEKTADKIPVTSSIPPKLPEAQEELFREVLALFEAKHLPYAVSGAFALQEHTGICRFTKDLDIFLSAEASTAALGYLRESSFEWDVCDPIWLAKARRGGYFVDLITGMSNGVITVGPSWIERARPATVVGVRSKVLAAEELLVSKLFVTRRERFDGADIAHIVYSSHGKLEWTRVFELAGEHWEILLWALVLFRYVYPAHSNYVPQAVWGDLLSRFAEALRCPDAGAPFRGSLIDDKMFAIDVNEWGLDDLLIECRARSPKINAPPDFGA